MPPVDEFRGDSPADVPVAAFGLGGTGGTAVGGPNDGDPEALGSEIVKKAELLVPPRLSMIWSLYEDEGVRLDGTVHM